MTFYVVMCTYPYGIISLLSFSDALEVLEQMISRYDSDILIWCQLCQRTVSVLLMMEESRDYSQDSLMMIDETPSEKAVLLVNDWIEKRNSRSILFGFLPSAPSFMAPFGLTPDIA